MALYGRPEPDDQILDGWRKRLDLQLVARERQNVPRWISRMSAWDLRR
ncbi:MAG TPA: hypothetical protein VH166_11625 [Mycobacterium sp.]|nr:hypothetical protein [Mycobacterium sp.]